MAKRWYIHKFYRGEHQGFHLSYPSQSYDGADKIVASLTKKYGRFGWTYEITDSDRKPCPGFVEQGAGI